MSNASFRVALINAARVARDKGDITKCDFAKLHVHACNDCQESLEDACKGELLASNVEGAKCSASEAINWLNLTAFLQGLLPLILEIVSLFHPVTPPAPAVA